MQFDPAVEAHAAFRRVQQTGDLGDDLDRALKAEETFSTETGESAKEAYRTLLEIGKRHPTSISFQEFLIYLTWQQVMAEPIPLYFDQGAKLCERYLSQLGEGVDSKQIRQVRELKASFQGGLGLIKEHPELYEEDTIKGGD
jgi:hypothetical protein